MLGHTRTVVVIEAKENNFFFNKVKNIKEISTEIDVGVHFLKNEDR